MSYRVYPVVAGEQRCDDYTVYVNGERVALHTARVSAYPFNRRWPGHQRESAQSELVNFLSMASDEEIELTIVPKIPSQALRICPRELEASATVDADGVIRVRVPGAAQFTVEPYGRSHALHVFIDPLSTYEVDREDASVVYFGAGEHDVGEIFLESGQTLFIDEGAVVYATVYALHVEDVRIIGRGILDNSKSRETVFYQTSVTNNDTAVANASREHAVNLLCAKNVTIDGITIRDSLLYTVECMSCEDLHVNNIKIIGNWRLNSDGVHFANCTRASLTNSFVRSFDDSICVRGFANYEYRRFLKDEKEEELSFVCRDVLVKNCIVWNDWGKGLQVGTETFSNEISGVRFEDCRVIHTTHKAIAVWLVDNAKIHDVTFRNISVEYDASMPESVLQKSDEHTYRSTYAPDRGGELMDLTISWHHEYSLIPSPDQLGEIRDVRIEGLKLFALQKPVFNFAGYGEKSTVSDVVLCGVYWNGEPISESLFKRQCSKNEFVEKIHFEQGEAL